MFVYITKKKRTWNIFHMKIWNTKGKNGAKGKYGTKKEGMAQKENMEHKRNGAKGLLTCLGLSNDVVDDVTSPL